MKQATTVLIAGAALLLAQSVAAHHSFSMYDSRQDLELAGTVSVRGFDGNHELTPLKSARVARPLAAVADAVADFVGSNAS